MYHPFTIGETIRKAWDVIKKNYIVLIVFTMITFVGKFIDDYISIELRSQGPYIQFAGLVLIILVETYLIIAFYKLLFILMDKEYYDFEIKDVIPSFKMAFYTFLILFARQFLVIVVPFIDFVIIKNYNLGITLYIIECAAGLYIAIRLIFCLCFIVDDNSGLGESLVQSFRVTRGNFFKLLAMILMVVVFVAIVLLLVDGIITLLASQSSVVDSYAVDTIKIIWLAITFPTVQVMIITTYRKLVYSHQDVDDDVSETL